MHLNGFGGFMLIALWHYESLWRYSRTESHILTVGWSIAPGKSRPNSWFPTPGALDLLVVQFFQTGVLQAAHHRFLKLGVAEIHHLGYSVIKNCYVRPAVVGYHKTYWANKNNKKHVVCWFIVIDVYWNKLLIESRMYVELCKDTNVRGQGGISMATMFLSLNKRH